MCLSIGRTPEMRIDRIAARLLAFNSTPLVYSGAHCQIRTGDYWIIFPEKEKRWNKEKKTGKRKKCSEFRTNNNNDKSWYTMQKIGPSTIGLANAYYIYTKAQSLFRVLQSTVQTHSSNMRIHYMIGNECY